MSETWLFKGPNETAEVAFFIKMGLSPKRAVAFCQILDDKPIVGVTATWLADACMQMINKEWFAAQRLRSECMNELRNMAIEEASQMKLF